VPILLYGLEACPLNKADLNSLPAALRAAQACRYLIYAEADFEVFRPARATRCTDWDEIWHGGGAKFHPNRWNVSPLWGEKKP